VEYATAVTPAPVATEEPALKKKKDKEGKSAPPVDGLAAMVLDADGERIARKEKKAKHSTSATTNGHGDVKIMGASIPESLPDLAPAVSKDTVPADSAKTTGKSKEGKSTPGADSLAEMALDADNERSARKEKKKKSKEEKAKNSTSAATDAQGDVKMLDASVPDSPDTAPAISENTVPNDSAKPTKEKKKRKSDVKTNDVVPTGEAKPLEAVNGAPSEREKKSKKSRKSITEDVEKDVSHTTSVLIDEKKPKKDKKGKGDRGLKEKKSNRDLTADA
jgi:hypothetical protein